MLGANSETSREPEQKSGDPKKNKTKTTHTHNKTL